MRELWAVWPRVRRRVRSAKKRLLLLDFDGTLVSIARTPDEVVFKRRTKALLRALARRPNTRVAIVSGRSLENLKPYFGLSELVYVGNHGLEMSGPGIKVPAEALRARRLQFLLWTLVEKLSNTFAYMPGILVENKGLTISLHYRNLAPEHAPAFQEALAFFKRRYARQPLVWKRGKKVWEVFPKVHWHKGFAAVHLLKRFPGSLPVVIGDDRTDEDMFRAMKRFGVTVRVGRSRNSLARYYVGSQTEVDALLEELIA